MRLDIEFMVQIPGSIIFCLLGDARRAVVKVLLSHQQSWRGRWYRRYQRGRERSEPAAAGSIYSSPKAIPPSRSRPRSAPSGAIPPRQPIFNSACVTYFTSEILCSALNDVLGGAIVWFDCPTSEAGGEGGTDRYQRGCERSEPVAAGRI